MATIHIGRVISASLHVVFGQLRPALRIGLLPALVITLGQGVLIELGRYASGSSSRPWDLFEGLLFVVFEPDKLLAQFGWVVAILVCVLAVTYAGLANTWLMFVVTDRETGRWRLVRPGKRELRAAVALTAVVGASAAATIGIGYLGITIVISGSEWSGFIFVVVTLLATALLTARLLPVFPMIALGQGMNWRDGWQLARGTGWRLSLSLFLATVFVAVCVVLVGTAFDFAVYASGLAGGGVLLLGAHITLAVQSVTGVIAFMMFLASVGEAYRQLDGPGVGVPERLLSAFDD